MYIIKHQPEDFIVKENSIITPQQTGDYAYFILKKKNYSTLEALQLIADKLVVHFKHLGYAGLKDKKAITEQVCSAYKVSQQQLEQLSFDNIGIQYLGRGDKPVSLGDLKGNTFTITVRNIIQQPPLKTTFINYFGEQRFSKQNAVIGKLLVQKKFKEATALLQEYASILNYLKQHPTDVLGALRTLPLKLLKFYIHAYQSHLWNRLAVEYPAEKILPIIGFGTPETPVVKKMLSQEGLTPRDFIIKQFPELSSEGGERNTFVQASHVSFGQLSNDEFYPGNKKIVLSFTLQKGSYATEYVRQLFESS